MGKINEELFPILAENYVADYILKNGNVLITDYRQLKKLAFFKSAKINEVELVEHRPIRITSLEQLEEVLLKLVESAVATLRMFSPDINTEQVAYRDFGELKVELLIEQLVFDILCDKYVSEAVKLNRNEYATYISKKIFGDEELEEMRVKECGETAALVNIRAIYENISGGMDKTYELINNPNLHEQFNLLGIDREKLYSCFDRKTTDESKKKKPIYVWNNYYFNYGINMKDPFYEDTNIGTISRGTISLTTRQHRRQVDGKGHKYSYKRMYEDLKSYCELVNKFLPREKEEHKTYFHEFMEYFFLESYKRIDYILKLVDHVPKEIMDEYSFRTFRNCWGIECHQRFFLCERFSPLVIIPYEHEGNIEYAIKNKYYRPMIKIEEAILEECIKDRWRYMDHYKDLLQKYYCVRAKAYELFHYYYIFNMEDYADINSYLKECYDMRAYHETTDIWNIIKKYDSWEKLDKKMQSFVRKKMQYFKQINDLFFWKSPEREIKK